MSLPKTTYFFNKFRDVFDLKAKKRPSIRSNLPELKISFKLKIDVISAALPNPKEDLVLFETIQWKHIVCGSCNEFIQNLGDIGTWNKYGMCSQHYSREMVQEIQTWSNGYTEFKESRNQNMQRSFRHRLLSQIFDTHYFEILTSK